MMEFYYKSLAYFSQHPILNSVAHSFGGFGLALLLQYYIKGDAFLPFYVGWVCVAISVVIHVMSLFYKEPKKGFF